jgi:hypothetical protein
VLLKKERRGEWLIGYAEKCACITTGGVTTFGMLR